MKKNKTNKPPPAGRRQQPIVHEHITPAELVAKMKPTKTLKEVKPRVHANRLRELRTEVGLTLREVSSGLGPIRKLSQASICDAERGGEVVLSTAKALAMFYGKTIEEIWPNDQGNRAAAKQPG